MKKYKTNFPIDGIYPNYGNLSREYSDYLSHRTGYPMPSHNNLYDMNLEDSDEYYEKEVAYMRDLYPGICKKIQMFIDKACDKMDYEDSYMFDEYPDKTMIDIITDRIYNEAKDSTAIGTNESKDSKEKSDTVEGQVRRPAWLRHLINVMFINEMYRRRGRRYRDKNHPFRIPYQPLGRRYYSPYKDVSDYKYYDDCGCQRDYTRSPYKNPFH